MSRWPSPVRTSKVTSVPSLAWSFFAAALIWLKVMISSSSLLKM